MLQKNLEERYNLKDQYCVTTPHNAPVFEQLPKSSISQLQKQVLETVHILETYVLKNQTVKSIKCDFILGENDQFFMVKIAQCRLRFVNGRNSFARGHETHSTMPGTSFAPTMPASFINHASADNMVNLI